MNLQDEGYLEHWRERIGQLVEKIRQILPQALSFRHPEDLHQSRIAFRKLLTFLEFLKKPGKRSRSQNQLRQIIKKAKWAQSLLGEMRDKDVFLHTLLPANSALDPELTGQLSSLIGKDRDSIRLKCILEIDADRMDEFLIKLERLLDRYLPELLHQTDPEVQLKLFTAQFEERCVESQEIRNAVGIYHQDSLRSLHRVRISAKRLRYSLKYIPYFFHCTEIEIDEFKNIQDNLGELNDYRNFSEYLASLKVKYKGLFPRALDRYRDGISEEIKKRAAMGVKTLELIYNEKVPHASRGCDSHAPVPAAKRDLKSIKGIGNKFSELLQFHGIQSLGELAEMDYEDLGDIEINGVPIKARAKKEQWIEQAREKLQ